MSIPVIYQFAKLTRKDTLLGFVVLKIITRPAIHYIIVFCHTSGMHISSSDWPIGIRILVLGNLQGLKGKLLRIARLVQDRFPHKYARMISVTTNDISCVFVHLLIPALVFVPVLPTRCSYNDKQSQFIAGIHKRRVLRIMGSTDNGKSSITQALGITPLLTIRQGISHIGKVLMTIGAYQLVILLAIQPKTFLTLEFKTADANLGNTTIERLLTFLNASGYLV